MSFALLAPAALALGLLVLGPVLAHRVRRRPDERVAYGAMLLLERLRLRVERRRRLHDLLLLLLRILLIVLVVLAIARPELTVPAEPAEVGSTGRVVVILDTSLSMDQREGGESALTRAQREAATLVRSLSPGVQIAVFGAGLPDTPLLPSWSADPALAASIVEGARQTYGGTDLDGALTRARALLDGQPGEVVIYTDASGPGTVASARTSLERLAVTGSTVLPKSVGVGSPANVVVADAKYGDGLEGGSVSFRVRNYGVAPQEVPATVRLPDGAEMTVFVAVEGATADGPAEAEASVTVPRQAQGGVASVTVADANLPLDDTRYFHLPRVGQSRVLVVDGDPGSSPTRSEVYFLERALAPSGGIGATVDVVAPAGAARLAEGAWRVAILGNVGDPTALAPTLVDFVRGGGALVLTVGDNVSASVWNGALAPLLPAPLTRPRDLVAFDDAAGAPLAAPDPAEELFAPFATLGQEGFARVRSRRIFAVESYDEAARGADGDGVRTLLRYASGAPALLERRIGNGRVYLWTSTADLGWTDFPLQSVYVPFWTRLCAWLGGELGGAGARLDGVVGDEVSVPVPAGESLEVRGPDGQRVGVDRRPGAIRFVPDVPGAYAVGRPDEPPAAWVAVNVPAAESDVRADEAIAAVQAELTPDRVRERVPLDGALVGAAAAALVAIGWLARRAVPEAEAA